MCTQKLFTERVCDTYEVLVPMGGESPQEQLLKIWRGSDFPLLRNKQTKQWPTYTHLVALLGHQRAAWVTWRADHKIVCTCTFPLIIWAVLELQGAQIKVYYCPLLSSGGSESVQIFTGYSWQGPPPNGTKIHKMSYTLENQVMSAFSMNNFAILVDNNPPVHAVSFQKFQRVCQVMQKLIAPKHAHLRNNERFDLFIVHLSLE